MGAFEQLFGPMRREFEQKFSKISNARGVARGRVDFSWWEMSSSRKRTRSVRPSGKYRSIQPTKLSEIQTGNFGRMERAPNIALYTATEPAVRAAGKN